jgi:16S rRNA (cytidine1402-2'-O)-methyltransferase
LITDAGTPLISDPGYEITRLAIEADVMVCVLPGPSAVLAALSVSGLPPDRFVFEGFLPKKSGGRKNRLLELASENRTVVFYESARRVERTLTEMVGIFGGARRACIARELTKLHEEVLRGSLDELIEELHGRVLKGEVTLVVEGVTRKGRHQREKNRIQ